MTEKQIEGACGTLPAQDDASAPPTSAGILATLRIGALLLGLLPVLQA